MAQFAKAVKKALDNHKNNMTTPKKREKQAHIPKPWVEENLERLLTCYRACADLKSPAEAIEGLKQALKMVYDNQQFLAYAARQMGDYEMNKIETALKTAGVEL